MTGASYGDLGRMYRQAVDLSRLGLEVGRSAAHPDGRCVSTYLPCAGCAGPAPLEAGYCGATVAHCYPCGFSWTVEHDPRKCWQQPSAAGQLAGARRSWAVEGRGRPMKGRRSA